jgi:hypothetical protein
MRAEQCNQAANLRRAACRPPNPALVAARVLDIEKDTEAT